jgi:hypothetical protein
MQVGAVVLPSGATSFPQLSPATVSRTVYLPSLPPKQVLWKRSGLLDFTQFGSKIATKV